MRLAGGVGDEERLGPSAVTDSHARTEGDPCPCDVRLIAVTQRSLELDQRRKPTRHGYSDASQATRHALNLRAVRAPGRRRCRHGHADTQQPVSRRADRDQKLTDGRTVAERGYGGGAGADCGPGGAGGAAGSTGGYGGAGGDQASAPGAGDADNPGTLDADAANKKAAAALADSQNPAGAPGSADNPNGAKACVKDGTALKQVRMREKTSATDEPGQPPGEARRPRAVDSSRSLASVSGMVSLRFRLAARARAIRSLAWRRLSQCEKGGDRHAGAAERSSNYPSGDQTRAMYITALSARTIWPLPHHCCRG